MGTIETSEMKDNFRELMRAMLYSDSSLRKKFNYVLCMYDYGMTPQELVRQRFYKNQKEITENYIDNMVVYPSWRRLVAELLNK